MKRRTFIELGLGLSAVAGAATYGWLSLRPPRATDFSSLSNAIEYIENLPDNAFIVSSGYWSAHQIFVHLKQSVDYSMVGFPEQKSKWFQVTLGSLAYHLFEAKGGSTHPLFKPIPGAEPLPVRGNTYKALQSLAASLKQFQQSQNFKPHFAYGTMSKSQYELAHLMHINEHFSEIDVVLPPGEKQ